MQALTKGLGFDPQVFLIQIGIFLALWAFMSATFWKPVLEHIRGRAQRISEAHDRVRETQHEMEGLRADYLARMAQVESEARAHIQATIREAQGQRERIIADARADAAARVQSGVAAMQKDWAASLDAMRHHLPRIAVASTAKAMSVTADEAAVERFVHESVDELLEREKRARGETV